MPVLSGLRHGLRAGQSLMRLIDEKNVSLIAAGVAFYSILAVFPAAAAIIALWGVIGDPGRALAEVAEFKALLPLEVFDLITAQLTALIDADPLTLGWASGVSFFLTLWSARAGVAALMKGLNAIYGAPNRKGIAHVARALFLTFCLVGVAVTALVCVVVAPVALQFVPLGRLANIGIDLARWFIALMVLFAAFMLIYRLGPNVHRTRVLVPGAIFATLGWAAASAGFSIYLANFGNYNEVYGSIGAVIAMLMWLFISAWLALLGGALNARLELRVNEFR